MRSEKTEFFDIGRANSAAKTNLFHKKTVAILPEKLGLLNDYSGKNKNAVIRLKKMTALLGVGTCYYGSCFAGSSFSEL